MDYETSCQSPEQALADVVQPTDLRPDFCAEALSAFARICLLLTAFGMGALMSLLLAAIWPDGLITTMSGLVAPELTGILLTVSFLLFIVFGALAANNPRLAPLERGMWFVAFALVAPLAFPAYWLAHVSPVPYESTAVQRL